ncbi:MAG: hypothetical protein K2M73_10025 [Lachnospiraceae bacterium]|nr:hypothetical protein [Lachnospiraceae bacterium]
MGKAIIQKDLSYLEKYFGEKYQRRFISLQDGAALYSLSYTAFRKLDREEDAKMVFFKHAVVDLKCQ